MTEPSEYPKIIRPVRICAQCGADFGRSRCPECHCYEYDDIHPDELLERRSGGLDKDS